ncbi:hypothetical protein H0H87_003973 [Tephrocybe sp. NHM501043]|nr:hypothetical protein H0H87_003973 [Tephrocybe sp. NHM501043]
MVAANRILAASATLVFGVLPILAEPSPAPVSDVHVSNLLLKRGEAPSIELDIVPANCQDVCKASNSKTSAFGKCLSCVVTSPNPPVDKTTTQEAIDALTATCDKEGFKVNDVKLGQDSGAIRPAMMCIGALIGIALGAFSLA